MVNNIKKRGKRIWSIFVVIIISFLILGVFPSYLIFNFEKDVRLADLGGLEESGGEQEAQPKKYCPEWLPPKLLDLCRLITGEPDYEILGVEG